MKTPNYRPKKLTDTTIPKLQPEDRRYDNRDHKISNLYLTVYPSGKKAWVFRYRAEGKSKRYRIGDGSAISPAKARTKAKTLAGDIANGLDPNFEKQVERQKVRKSKDGTLRKFIEDDYRVSRTRIPQILKRMDKRRTNLYSYFGRKDYDDPKLYDLVLNMSMLGIDKAVELTCKLVNG